MATQRIYYDDSFARDFDATIRTCEPYNGEVAISAAPAWRVTLDRTAFYPTSGGQPFDLGTIGDARVVEVLDEGEEIAHIVDRELPPGATYAHIDWARRFDHMQQHTGQHLLSAILQQRFALPTVSFHLGAELCSIDVRGAEPTQDILDKAAVAVNEIVYEDRSVNVKYGTAEELAAAGVRKTVEREGILRAIELEGLELQPCGGTHVARTGQIGTILLRGVSKIRQDWRIEFVCGARAERLARGDFATLKSVARKLNCAVSETVVAAERAVTERDAHFKSARASLERLAEVDARAAVQAAARRPDGLMVIAQIMDGLTPEYAQSFAREVSKTDKAVALLVRGECGSVFFSQNPAAGKDMNALLGTALKQIGGKGGGSRDAARGKLADPPQAQALLDAALAQLGSATTQGM
jgi:alanyl-tRNA synthetase